MTTATTGAKPYYFVPQPSHWPILGSCALLLMGTGAAFWFNGYRPGPWIVLAGFCVLLVMLFGWFGTVIGESEGRLYNKKVDLSFRWSMSWFIFSEVMFFAAFFGALFYVRNVSVPDLGGSLTGRMLWPDYAAQWPTVGPYIQQQFSPMGAIGIPLLNLKLTTGVYGSTFFMLTGFHGLHVTIGAIMLTVMLVRAFRGHFDAEHHFGFEAAAWYWHFVDVVWLLLFVLVYWL